MQNKPAIDADVVKKVAVLARLDVDDAKAAAFSQELSRVLEHIQKLAEVNVDGVEPFTHRVTQGGETGSLRPDEYSTAAIDPASITATAPSLAGAGYKVPPIL